MAGLLTYPKFNAPSRGLVQWQVAKNRHDGNLKLDVRQELQQRVLSRNHTSFPFDALCHSLLNYGATISAAKLHRIPEFAKKESKKFGNDILVG